MRSLLSSRLLRFWLWPVVLLLVHALPVPVVAAAPAAPATPATVTILDRFTADVVRVKDGDSVVVFRPDVKRQNELRLAGLDAPELAQPWGIQARTALRRMIDGKRLTIEVTDRDRYGRLVARLWLGRTYVNAEMVRQGDAWAFRRYLDDPAIRKAQIAARKAKRGLWSLPPEQQIFPGTWRATHPRRF